MSLSEYILVTLDEIDEDNIKFTQIGSLDLEEYFDKDTLKEILQCYEVGES